MYTSTILILHAPYNTIREITGNLVIIEELWHFVCVHYGRAFNKNSMENTKLSFGTKFLGDEPHCQFKKKKRHYKIIRFAEI